MADVDPDGGMPSSERRISSRKKLIIDVRFDEGDGTGITPIMMTLSIGAQELNLKGVVVYSDPGHGVGVRFRDLGAEDEAVLRSELAIG